MQSRMPLLTYCVQLLRPLIQLIGGLELVYGKIMAWMPIRPFLTFIFMWRARLTVVVPSGRRCLS